MPDLRRPDLRRPDAAVPDLRRPDLRRPDAAEPDAALPDLRRPDLAGADLLGPDAGVLLPVGAEITLSQARNGGARPAVSGLGYQWLVVWENTGNIYGTRVAQNGTVWDTAELNVAVGMAKAVNPAVACDSTLCLVVWEHTPPTSGATYIYGARVNSVGVVMDFPPLQISTSTPSADPDVAFDGSAFLVTWAAGAGALASIVAAKVTTGGSVGMSFSVVKNTGQVSAPAVAFDGTNYLVVWRDETSTVLDPQVHGQLLDPSGATTGTTNFRVSTSTFLHEAPEVARGGNQYLVTWNRYRDKGGLDQDIRGARVSTAGKGLDNPDLPVCTNSAFQWGQDVAGAPTGSFLAVWQDGRVSGNAVYGARIDSTGTVLDPLGRRLASNARATDPAVAFAGSYYLVVWVETDSSGTLSNIRGVRASAP